MASGRENCLVLLAPIGPLHSGVVCPCGPPVWRLTPDISSPRSLDLAAMDTKLVVVNWNSRYSHLMWVQRPWQEIKQTPWFELTASLSCCLGHHLYATNGAPSQMWGCLPTWKKGSHLPPGTTKLGKIRDSHNSTTAPTAKPDPGFSRLLGECWSVDPTQGCQKCDRGCLAQVH